LGVPGDELDVEDELVLPAVPSQPVAAKGKTKAKATAAHDDDAALAELAAWVNT
jgi:hypothetical protein